MQIPILIEEIEGERYRAIAGAPFAITAEGDTRNEAYQKLERMVHDRLRAGAALLAMEVSLSNPQILACRVFKKDDPFFETWQQAIAENRQLEDAQGP